MKAIVTIEGFPTKTFVAEEFSLEDDGVFVHLEAEDVESDGPYTVLSVAINRLVSLEYIHE